MADLADESADVRQQVRPAEPYGRLFCTLTSRTFAAHLIRQPFGLPPFPEGKAEEGGE